METIKIPHAKIAFVDQSEFPREILVVVTELPKHSPAGPEADARHDMLKAIVEAVADRHLQGHDIRWGSR
jgi:hypothetical protein